MIYVLIFGGDPITLASLQPAESAHLQAEVDAWWMHYRNLGIILGGAQLKAPLTATTVGFTGNSPSLHDGPFGPERDAVGGFGIVETFDLDEALGIALSWPAGGYVEVRPVHLPATPADVIGAARQEGTRIQEK